MPPDEGHNNTKNLWYSFDYGPIHFLAMSGEHNFTVGSFQSDYLIADLELVNRTLTPWVVVVGRACVPMRVSW